VIRGYIKLGYGIISVYPNLLTVSTVLSPIILILNTTESSPSVTILHSPLMNLIAFFRETSESGNNSIKTIGMPFHDYCTATIHNSFWVTFSDYMSLCSIPPFRGVHFLWQSNSAGLKVRTLSPQGKYVFYWPA
jgi:hypothetical protein